MYGSTVLGMKGKLVELLDKEMEAIEEALADWWNDDEREEDDG